MIHLAMRGHRQLFLCARDMTDQPMKMHDQVRDRIRLKHYSIHTDRLTGVGLNTSFFSMTSGLFAQLASEFGL